MNKFSKKSLILLGIIPGLLLISCNSGSSSDSSTSNNVPLSCVINIANFSSLESTSLIGTPTGTTWGPNLANLPFPEGLAYCQQYLSSNQGRILSAAKYWVSQKVNYCHHHVPTWIPSLESSYTPSVQASYESCSMNTDIMPPVPAESFIRWNYSGTGSESANAWAFSFAGYYQGNYGNGLDCSDYSRLLYSYAESIIFTSAISPQAGQGNEQESLAPNMTGFVDSNESDINGLYSAGNLVCADGTLAPPRGGANSSSCNGHGGYISVFNSDGSYNESAITDTILNVLQPGDLLYVSGCASDPTASSDSLCNYDPRQLVTHVIVWTGQKIGSSLYITESMIAPESDKDVYGQINGQCGTESNPYFWSVANNMGNWIITDSHYQGPDFRAFTYCFYRNQIWGVRRVLQ